MTASLSLCGYAIFTARKLAEYAKAEKDLEKMINAGVPDSLSGNSGGSAFIAYLPWIAAALVLIILAVVLIIRRKKRRPKQAFGSEKQTRKTRDRSKGIPAANAPEAMQANQNNASGKYVFLSYKAEERSTLDQIIKEVLEVNGIPYWVAPESIPAGSSYAQVIEQSIQNCSVFVLVLSAGAMHSKWVEKELDRAIVHNRIIIPFQIEPCELTEAFRFYLSNVQRVKAFTSVQNRFELLVTQIHKALA